MNARNADAAGFIQDARPCADIPAGMVPVLSIDAWRDCGGGWTWNSWYRIGFAPLAWADLKPRAMLRRMRDAGIITASSAGRVAVDDDGYNVVVVERGTREPVIALAYGEIQH